MATEIRGVQPVTNIPSARLRVRYQNNGEIVGRAMEQFAEVANRFAEDEFKRKATATSAALEGEIATAQFEAQRPENATNATQFFRDKAREIITGYDLGGLPVEYRDAVTAQANEYVLRSMPGLLKYQAGASLDADIATDDAGFAGSESLVRRHGQSRGVLLDDLDANIQREADSREQHTRELLTGDLPKEAIDERVMAQRQELWLSAISERAAHDAAGARELLQHKIDTGVVLANEDTERMFAAIAQNEPGQLGSEAGRAAFDLYPDDAEARERWLVENVGDKAALTEARKTADRLVSAREANQEESRKASVTAIGEAVDNLASERRGFAEAAGVDPLYARGGEGPQVYSPYFEQRRIQLRQDWTSAGLPLADFDDLWQKRVVEGADIKSSEEALFELRTLSPGDLANVDLGPYRARISKDHYEEWLGKQRVAQNQWNVTAMDEQIKAAAAHFDKGEDRDNFTGQIWSALAAASRDLEGKGYITDEQFGRILADTKSAVVTGGWLEDALGDETASAALELIEDEGSDLQRETLRLVREKLQRNAGGFAVPEDQVLAAWRLAMTRVGPTYGTIGEEVRERLESSEISARVLSSGVSK